MNMTMIKVISSMFKKHKLFFANVGSYLNTCPLFADFWPLKSISRDWALLVHLVHIRSLSAPKLCSNFSIPCSAHL